MQHLLIRRNDSDKIEAYLEEMPGPGLCLCLNVQDPQDRAWSSPDGLCERPQPPPPPPSSTFPLAPASASK